MYPLPRLLWCGMLLHGLVHGRLNKINQAALESIENSYRQGARRLHLANLRGQVVQPLPVAEDSIHRQTDEDSIVGEKNNLQIAKRALLADAEERGIMGAKEAPLPSPPGTSPQTAQEQQDALSVTRQFNDGSGFRKVECRSVKRVAEWRICWSPVALAIDWDRCVVYSFGIADEDLFTDVMANLGCTVYAFDPGFNHPRDYKHNVKFYRYGLVTGSTHENNFSGVYGKTDRGVYKTFEDIRMELNHTATEVTLMKVDCEGCEWNLFSTMKPATLDLIRQVLVEFHFSDTLRFNQAVALKYARRAKENLERAGLGSFSFVENIGFERDRHVDERLVAAGIKQGSCCREVSLVRASTPALDIQRIMSTLNPKPVASTPALDIQRIIYPAQGVE